MNSKLEQKEKNQIFINTSIFKCLLPSIKIPKRTIQQIKYFIIISTKFHFRKKRDKMFLFFYFFIHIYDKQEKKKGDVNLKKL